MTNTQFSIAVHMMAGLGAHGESGLKSHQMATSVNTCPSFVRRVLSKLAKSGLVRTTTGKSGSCALARDPKNITLLEIYKAVEAPKAFAIHDYPVQKSCAISCGIKASMLKVQDDAQDSMEAGLKKVTLAQILAGMK